MAGTQDFEPYVSAGSTFGHLIAIVRDMNAIATNGRLRGSTISIPQAHTALRNATGDNALKFQTCTIADLKAAFFVAETPDFVVQQALDTMSAYEKAIEAIQTEATGLPPENS